MTERVRINASREDRQSVAQKLLDAAGDDLQVVRVSGNGFVVPKSVAEKAGLLEPSAPAASAAPDLAAAEGDSVTSPDTAADSAEAGVQEPVVAEPKPAKATKR